MNSHNNELQHRNGAFRIGMVTFHLAMAIAIGIAGGNLCAQESTAAAKTNFDDHIKSILRQRCASCHGPDSKKGDLDVTNFTNLMQGGSSGSVVEPGDADGSYLFNLVTHEDEPVMPPSGKIPAKEIELIRAWIEMGALENKGSKAVMAKKPSVVQMGANPLQRPEVVASFPRLTLQPTQHTPRNPIAASMASSPWAPLVAVAGKRQVLLYNSQNLQLIGVLPFPEGTVNVVRFSRSGSVLLAAGGRAGASGVAVMWDVTSGQRIGVVGDELDEVMAADISPDHAMVALGGSGRLVNVYSTETGDVLYTIKKHTDWITSLAFSTDGVLLASGDRNGGLHVWESWTGRDYATLKGHSASINSIAWRADSNVMASASLDTTIKLWELNNGTQVKSWAAHSKGVNDLVFTRDGRVLSTGVDRTTKLWGQDGKQLATFQPLADIGLSVSWCDETNRALAGDYLGNVHVWESQTPEPVIRWNTNPPTLATRLTASQSDLAKAIQAAEPLQQTAKLATEAAKKVQDLQALAQAEEASAQQAHQSVQTAMLASNEKASQTQQQLANQQLALQQYNEAKPLLQQALTSLTQASEKLTNDKTVENQRQQLSQRIEALVAQITAAEKESERLTKALQSVTSQVKATDSQVKQTAKTLAAAQSKTADLTKQLAPLVTARDQASAQLQKATEEVQRHQQLVNRWQSEIQFVQQLKELQVKLEQAQNAQQEKQQTLDLTEQALQSAQQKTDAARNQLNQAKNSVQAVEAEIRAAQGIGKDN